MPALNRAACRVIHERGFAVSRVSDRLLFVRVAFITSYSLLRRT
jgi:hypothetical protein